MASALLCLTGALFRSALLILLFATSCGKRTCDYRKILDSYRELILVELQNMNLTGASTHHKERDPCPSGKAHRILSSIYGMAQQVRCQRGRKEPSDLEKPVGRMEQLIIYNCNSDNLEECILFSLPENTREEEKEDQDN